MRLGILARLRIAWGVLKQAYRGKRKVIVVLPTVNRYPHYVQFLDQPKPKLVLVVVYSEELAFRTDEGWQRTGDIRTLLLYCVYRDANGKASRHEVDYSGMVDRNAAVLHYLEYLTTQVA